MGTMKLYIANSNKIYSYQLRDFQEEYIVEYHSTYNNEIKKIEIKEHEKELYIVGSLNINIYENKRLVEFIKLKEDNYYNIHINDTDEDIILIAKKDDTEYIDYKLINDTLTIGKELDDIEYTLEELDTITIKKKDNKWYLSNKNKNVYLNNNYVTNAIISTGDKIIINNLFIIFMNNFIRVSKPKNTNIRLKRVLEDPEDNTILTKEEIQNKHQDNIVIYNETITPLETLNINLDVDYIDETDRNTIYYQICTIIVIILVIIAISTILVSISSVLSGNSSLLDEKIHILGAILMLLVAFISYLFIKKNSKSNTSFNYNEYFKKCEKEINERLLLEKDYYEKLYPSIDTIISNINNNKNIFNKSLDNIILRIATGSRKANINLDTGKLLYGKNSNRIKDSIEKLESKLILEDTAITYNFNTNKTLSIKLNTKYKKEYIDRLLIELITSYNPEELKLVIICNEDNKYLYQDYFHIPHLIGNKIRFLASNIEEIKTIEDYIKKNKNTKYMIINDSLFTLENDNCYYILFNSNNNILEVNDNNIIYNDNTYSINHTYLDTHTIISKIVSINPNTISNLLDYKISYLDLYKVGNIKDLKIEDRWNNSTKNIIIGLNNDEEIKVPLDNTIVIGNKESREDFILTYLLSLSINYNPQELSIYLLNGTNIDIDIPHIVNRIEVSSENDYYRLSKILEQELTKDKNILLIINEDNISNNSFFISDIESKNKKNRKFKFLIGTDNYSEKLKDTNYLKILFNTKDVKDITERKVESLNNKEFYYIQDEPIKVLLPDLNTLYAPKNNYIKNNDNRAIFINNIGYNYKYVDLEEKKHSIKYFLEKEIDNLTDAYSNTAYLNILPDKVYLADLLKQYPVSKNRYSYEIVLGIFENLNTLEHKPLILDLLLAGNIIIYSSEEKETSSLVKTMILSLCYYHHPEELNISIIDNEANLSSLSFLPQIASYIKKDEEKALKILDYLQKEYEERKRILIRYDNNINIYNKRTKEKIPVIITVINDFQEKYNRITKYQDMLKNAYKYGMIIIATSKEEVNNKYFDTKIALKLKDSFDYRYLLNAPNGLIPASNSGRGLISFAKEIYEFQSAILNEEDLIDTTVHTAGTKLYKYYKVTNRKKDV